MKARSQVLLLLTALSALLILLPRNGTAASNEGGPPPQNRSEKHMDVILPNNWDGPDLSSDTVSPSPGEDQWLAPDNWGEVMSEAVIPDASGDDAVACQIAANARTDFIRGRASRSELEQRVGQARRAAASPAMREALDQFLSDLSLPVCPPVGRP